MRQTNHRRAPFLLAFGVLTLALLPARAADDGVTRSHADGYPRCSDMPPTPVEQSPDGYGKENDSDGTQFDTNWVLDASPGDTDAVWMIVRDACIDGGGLVVDADTSSATRARQDGWGEDRITFQASAGSAGGTITVRNRISVSAAWVIDGNGRNSAVLIGEMVDIYGKVHKYQQSRSVSPTQSTTETTTETDSANQTHDVDLGLQDDGATAGTEGKTEQSQTEGETRSVTATAASTDSGSDFWELEVSKTYTGTSCSVLIASAATISVQAQAISDGIETSTDVTEFDVHNIVDAAYVEPPVGTGLPATGGGPSGGPKTGGGGTSPPVTGGEGTGPKTLGEDDDPHQPPTPPDDGTEPDSEPGTEPGDDDSDPTLDDDPTDSGPAGFLAHPDRAAGGAAWISPGDGPTVALRAPAC